MNRKKRQAIDSFINSLRPEDPERETKFNSFLISMAKNEDRRIRARNLKAISRRRSFLYKECFVLRTYIDLWISCRHKPHRKYKEYRKSILARFTFHPQTKDEA
ncbi:hypothetical protein Spico_0830 [Parasphaerochaeta coccoides DSM 17374]|uniref:Uncharacterized protein n=1 Tax=Parasphaerochaeta coccoides (strain ATCC BAA-1237 / DSM 17374 / SPN1) TaxID=760011 RepID=F4GHU1_PARC1|nr:hypothetical protein Spico_0830 [Parasphaerochaeta coccoides DSM 17374]